MKALGIGPLTAAVAIFALPSVATAEYLVPPGNSAVNQYTESVPTAGGHRDLDKARGTRDWSPARALGAENARRLEAQGPEGQEAAEVAAATAPRAGAATAPGNAGNAGSDGASSEEGGGGSSGGGSGGGGGAADGTSGSSGLVEVLAQATGSSSSGQLSPLLPLAIAAAIAWAVAFFVRQRNRPTP